MTRRLTSVEQLAKDRDALYRAVQEEGPLPCVLIATAFLEKALTLLLSRFFVKCETAKGILGENGFLGEFGNCNDMAYCLGLISKAAFQNLKTIGKIRNLFAHSHRFLDFDDKEIKDQCMTLKLPKGKYGPPLAHWNEQVDLDPRSRFIVVASQMFYHLMMCSAFGEDDRRKKKTDRWE